MKRTLLKLAAIAVAMLGTAAPAFAASSTIDCLTGTVGYDFQCVVTAGNTTTDVYLTWCRSDFRGEYTCDGSTEDTEWGYFTTATCGGTGSVDGCSGAYCGCTGLTEGDTATFDVTLPTDNAPDEYFGIFTDWDAVNILSDDIQLPVGAAPGDPPNLTMGDAYLGTLTAAAPFIVLGAFFLGARRKRSPSL